MSVHETQSGKFLPAFFVDVVDLGREFKSGELPLHMTYFPPVSAEFIPEYADDLRRYINPMKPFEARVGMSALFDSQEGPVHVRLLEPSDQLMAVHRSIVAVLQKLPRSTKHLFAYRPHITIANDDPRVQRGDLIHMGGLSVVEKPATAKTWRVMAKIGLKGDDGQGQEQMIIKQTKEQTI